MNHPRLIHVTGIFPGFTNPKLGISVVFFWALIAAYFTTVSSVYYHIQGISTDWFYLSLNHFSRAVLWMVLTPFLYILHRYLIRTFQGIFFKILLGIILGFFIATFHLFSSWYLDLSFRAWMGIIDISFWTSIQNEFYLLVKGVSNSFIIYLLIMGFFTGRYYFYINKDQNEIPSSTKYKTKGPLGYSFERFDNQTSPNREHIERHKAVIPKRIIVKSEGKMRFILPNEIRYVESCGNYIQIQLNGEKVVTRDTLKHMVTQLSTLYFYRINRSVIVNVDFIRELEPWFNGEFTVRLTDGHQFNTGRAFRDHLSRLLAIAE